MPFPFNRWPKGLLGLLDAKVGGQNPQLLSEVVNAELDVLPFYYASARETLQGNTLVAVGSGTAFFLTGTMTEVPSDEMWYVESLTALALAGLAAAQSVIAVPVHRTSVLGGGVLVVERSSYRFQCSQLAAQPSATIGRPFWALPGDQIGVQAFQTGGFSATYQGTATILRIKT